MRKKRILHVINSLNVGGAEILLANSLSPGGLNEHTENYLVYFNQASHLLNIIDKNVKLICLHYKGGADIFRVLRKLKRVITDNNIDIVHSHLTPSGIYTHLVCPSAVPQVHTIHSTYSMEKETRPVMRFIDRHFFFNKKNINIINLSDYTRDDFLKSISFKGKVFVLNNFVADRYFNFSPKKYDSEKKILRLVAAGTLKELKNFEYLLEIFKYLDDQEIYLDIYGGGDKAKYEMVIKNKSLKINMMGAVDDMAAVLPDYDLFIMPSKFEGFPLSVFEAMAVGIPLMLSDIGPLKSIVNENALYFKLNDAPAAAKMIKGICNGNININTMAQRAHAFAAATQKREKYIENLLYIYDQILNPGANKNIAD
jgi:glycosyltransferase involved in cell wall biosynthesis